MDSLREEVELSVRLANPATLLAVYSHAKVHETLFLKKSFWDKMNKFNVSDEGNQQRTIIRSVVNSNLASN